MAGALGLRAFHIDLKWQHYRFEHYLSLVDDLAGWGYNAIVVEYENMFPFRCCRKAVHRDAWTLEQVRAFVEKASARKMKVIPMVQCFGHLEFVLRLPAYRHLAENPEHPSELCPAKEGASPLVRAMIAEVLAAHPESDYVHIGGDEVWSLGTCARCKQNVRRIGSSRIYIDFVSPFIEQVVQAGRRPILWGDMLLSHPEALDSISRDVIVCDWQYWPEGIRQSQIMDWTSGTWVNPMTLPLVTKDTLRRYREHWAMDGAAEWPVHYKGWPYVGYLQKAGFDVILGSAIRSGGDNYSSVRYGMHLKNCLSGVQAASTCGALGMMVTSWAIRRAPLENQWLGMAVVGEAMRQGGSVDVDAVTRSYERKRFGATIDLCEKYKNLGAMVHCLNMTNYGTYTFEDHRLAAPSVESETVRAGGSIHQTPLLMRETASVGLHAADEILAWLDGSKLKGREIDVLRYSAQEVRYKAWLVFAMCEHLLGKKLDPAAIRQQTNRLKALLRETFEGYWTAWTVRDELRYRFSPDEAWCKGLR